MEHRRGVQVDVVRTHAHHLGKLRRVTDDVAVGEPNPLAAAGGAAGVHQDGVVVLVAFGGRRGCGFGETLLVLRLLGFRWRRGDPEHALTPGRQFLGFDKFPKGVVDRQQPALRIIENAANFRRRKAIVDRHRHGPHPVAGVVELGKTEGIAAHDGEALAAAQPEAVQDPRRARHPLRELLPSEVTFRVSDGRPPPVKTDRLVKHGCQRQHGSRPHGIQ